MDKELKCPKCGSDKRVKSGFNNKKQRYLCKKNVGVTTLWDSVATQSISGEKQYSCIWKEMALEESKEYLKLAMFLS